MKTKVWITAVLAAAVVFSACGKTDDSSSKSGKVSLETTTTTADAVTPDTDSSEADTTSVAETTTAVTETTSSVAEMTTTTAATTKKPETTTTAETTTTTTQVQTQAPQTEVQTQIIVVEVPVEDSQQEQQSVSAQEQLDPNSVRGKMRVVYNGFEFGVGDQMSAIEGNLGSQPAPSAKVSSCLSSEIVTEYYFYGMTVQVNNDIIFSIDIMDNAYYGDIAPETVGGIALNKTKSDMENGYGAGETTDDSNYYYTDGSRSMQVTIFDDSIARIWIKDDDLG